MKTGRSRVQGGVTLPFTLLPRSLNLATCKTKSVGALRAAYTEAWRRYDWRVQWLIRDCRVHFLASTPSDWGRERQGEKVPGISDFSRLAGTGFDSAFPLCERAGRHEAITHAMKEFRHILLHLRVPMTEELWPLWYVPERNG